MQHDFKDLGEGSASDPTLRGEIVHILKRIALIGVLIVVALFVAHVINKYRNIDPSISSGKNTGLVKLTADDDGSCGDQINLTFKNRSSKKISYVKYEILISDAERSGVSEKFSGMTNKILKAGDSYSECTAFMYDEYLHLISRQTMDRPVIAAEITDVVIAGN